LSSEHLRPGMNKISVELINNYRNDGYGVHSFTDKVDMQQYPTLSLSPTTATMCSRVSISQTSRPSGLFRPWHQTIGPSSRMRTKTRRKRSPSRARCSSLCSRWHPRLTKVN
jgi:hypothetical protein